MMDFWVSNQTVHFPGWNDSMLMFDRKKTTAFGTFGSKILDSGSQFGMIDSCSSHDGYSPVLDNRIDFAENRTRGDAGAMNKTPFLGAGIRSIRQV